MAIPERARFIGGLLGEEIDRDVKSKIHNEQAPFAKIAKDWTARYRDMRKSDPKLPTLVLQDFKDYLRWEYLVGSPEFYKLASKR